MPHGTIHRQPEPVHPEAQTVFDIGARYDWNARLNEHLTLTLSAQRRVKLRGSILARLRQLKLFVRQPRRPAPEAGPQSVRCPSRSCATTWAKCHGRSGRGPSSLDRLHGGTACSSPSGELRRNPGPREGNDFPGLERGQLAHYATLMVWTPTNSDSSLGSPSSRSMLTTSCRLPCSSSRVSPWLCAPGKPGTWPTNKPVSGSRSTTKLKLRMATFGQQNTPVWAARSTPRSAEHRS